MKKKLFLCDLGNVLVNFDHRLAVRRILPFTQMTFREVYELFFDSPLVKDYEEGRVSSRRFFEGVKELLGLRGISYKTFVALWSEIFFDNKEIVGLLKELRRDYRLHMISNINELHYSYIKKFFPKSLAVFDKLILSYEVGERKPHPKIYRAAVEGHGYRAEDALYVDDREDLIQAAAQMGIQGIIFKGTDHLRAQLKAMKVLT